MLRDNSVLKKMIATGEEQIGKFASQLLNNEAFMAALQKTVNAAVEAKGIAMRNVQFALSSLNVPTGEDVKKLEGKIEELERVFETLSARITELAKKNGKEPPAES
jgi:polyhydroxyalkanoate synthesis regulator phasin